MGGIMRTSKREVEAVFKTWCAVFQGRAAWDYRDVGAYRLDYASCYGGWRIERICNASGGVDDVFPYRLRSWEFVTALRIAIRSEEERRINLYEKERIKSI